MHIRFKEYACRSFAAWAQEALPEYEPCRSAMKHSFMEKPAVLLERKLDKQRRAWVNFGALQGEGHVFRLNVGWTCVGERPNQVEYWANRELPSGSVELSDLREFYGRPRDQSLRNPLELESPPKDLADELFARYLASPRFEEDYDFALKWELRKKKPLSDEEVKQGMMIGEKAFIDASWEHDFERFDIPERRVEDAVEAILVIAKRLVREKGLPFLEERLESCK